MSFSAFPRRSSSIWNAAVSYYANSLTKRDLLFDQGMEAIKNQLEDAETQADLTNVQVPVELKNVLSAVAPIYKKHWWKAHDVQDQIWIAQLRSLVDEYGVEICDDLVRIYEEPWPQHPVRVDAVAYANWAGACTTLEPTRPTISTTDPTNQGTAALEVGFHETSHGMMKKVMDAIDTAEKTANAKSVGAPIRFPRSLWHEVLFHTSGELVAERVYGYTPYAKNGLWARAWPGPDYDLIERDGSRI